MVGLSPPLQTTWNEGCKSVKNFLGPHQHEHRVNDLPPNPSAESSISKKCDASAGTIASFSLIQSFSEVGPANAAGAENSPHGVEGNVSFPPFNASNIGSVQARARRQSLLREAALVPKCAQHLTELCARGRQ